MPDGLSQERMQAAATECGDQFYWLSTAVDRGECADRLREASHFAWDAPERLLIEAGHSNYSGHFEQGMRQRQAEMSDVCRRVGYGQRDEARAREREQSQVREAERESQTASDDAGVESSGPPPQSQSRDDRARCAVDAVAVGVSRAEAARICGIEFENPERSEDLEPEGESVERPHVPARGTSERRELMEAVRPAAEAEFGPPVEFMVTDARVLGAYAYLDLQAQRPNGQRIACSQVDCRPATRVRAALARTESGWRVVQVVIGHQGAIDRRLCEAYPANVLPACE